MYGMGHWSYGKILSMVAKQRVRFHLKNYEKYIDLVQCITN